MDYAGMAMLSQQGPPDVNQLCAYSGDDPATLWS
jgi:hypothetical protein